MISALLPEFHSTGFGEPEVIVLDFYGIGDGNGIIPSSCLETGIIDLSGEENLFSDFRTSSVPDSSFSGKVFIVNLKGIHCQFKSSAKSLISSIRLLKLMFANQGYNSCHSSLIRASMNFAMAFASPRLRQGRSRPLTGVSAATARIRGSSGAMRGCLRLDRYTSILL